MAVPTQLNIEMAYGYTAAYLNAKISLMLTVTQL